MKYTIEEIKKFLDPNFRYHMSAHVIQSEAVEMCRQLVGMLDDKANEKTEYRKLWHDRIYEFSSFLRFNLTDRKEFIENFYLKVQAIINSDNFIDKLKAKFDKGMAEHGMGFEKVEFDKEIEDEMLDICNYFIGKNYSQKK